MRLSSSSVSNECGGPFVNNPQADMAPGKQRVAKVRGWLYEALHGEPEGAPISSQSSTSSKQLQERRDKMRKYKVGLPSWHRI